MSRNALTIGALATPLVSVSRCEPALPVGESIGARGLDVENAAVADSVALRLNPELSAAVVAPTASSSR